MTDKRPRPEVKISGPIIGMLRYQEREKRRDELVKRVDELLNPDPKRD